MGDNMPEQSQKTPQEKEEQLKREHDNQVRQHDERDKKEKQQKNERDQEAQRKNEKDKKEQERQDTIKKEQAEESNRVRCKICHKETFPVRRCFGHDSGGGSGGGGSGDSEEKVSSDDNAPTTFVEKIMNMASQIASAITQAIDGTNINITQQPYSVNENTFNSEVISDLLSKKLLLIENNRDSGILTIKLQCNQDVLSEEQRKELGKFVDTILKELDSFKKEKKISADCAILEKDHAGNFLSLRIHLPKPTLYDEFIQRLARKNLLPTQVLAQQGKEQIVYQEGMNHFKQTPFSTKLTHPTNKKIKSIDEEKYAAGKKSIEEKSSSIRPRSPLDGLKPKGFK